MTKGEISHEVKAFKKKYSVAEPNYDNLLDAAEKLGYVAIERDPLVEDIDVEKLICALSIDNELFNNRGFIYAKGDYRLIFIDGRLSIDEKTIVLAHEIGHIVLGHLKQNPVIGQDVFEEHAANQFAAELLEGRKKSLVMYFLPVIASLAILVAVIILSLVFYNKSQKTTMAVEAGKLVIDETIEITSTELVADTTLEISTIQESTIQESIEETEIITITEANSIVAETTAEVVIPNSAEGIVTEHESPFNRSRLLSRGDIITYVSFENGLLTFDSEKGPQYIIDLTEKVILGCTGSPANILSYREEDGILYIKVRSLEFAEEYEYRFFIPKEDYNIQSFEITGNMLIIFLNDGGSESFNIETGSYLVSDRDRFTCKLSIQEGILSINLLDLQTNNSKQYSLIIQ